MTEMRKNVTDQFIAEAAAAWFVRLQDEAVGEDEAAKFEDWLRQSARHRRAYEHVQAIWGDLGAFEAELRERYAVAPDGAPVPRGMPAPALPAARRPRAAAATGWRIAAALVALCLVGALYWGFGRAPRPANEIVTGLAEQTTTRLDDGSIVHLNAKSRIATAYTPSSRRVRLLEGEAYFEVAKDKERPFVVETKGGNVEAVGTAFNVNLLTERVTVAVAEGTVKIAGASRSALSVRRWDMTASAGELVSWTQDGPSPKLRVPVQEVATWRARRFVFNEKPLSEVVAEFNRYSREPIRIGSSALRDLKLSGVFEADDSAALLSALEWATGVRVVRTPGSGAVLFEDGHQAARDMPSPAE
ncbi:MAG: FecR domain-containing protein [Alphaproteobacteria bacterium]|nr:FecR domain-containing protein [Alphaproteobacteria bacterium]